MSKKVYYLTRSFAPYQKGGGPLIRKATVELLKREGWDVTVVMPNYNSSEFLLSENVVKIPLVYNKKIAMLLEMLGIYEDYLDKWINKAYIYLLDKIQKGDIILATSGGELGMIKLASLLKKQLNCKLIVNYHDPLDYSLVHGLKLGSRFHVSRERQEKKYISNADLIVTSSKSFEENLKNKYPKLSEITVTNYFGYIKKVNFDKYRQKICNGKLKIAYIGNMESSQKPELLIDIYQKSNYKKNIELYFIGDFENYLPIKNADFPNVHLLNYLPHEELIKFMVEHIDVGFVSLVDDYFGACFPSKIYEYINLELPILAALPKGDAKDLINTKGYGFAYNYDEIGHLAQALDLLTDQNIYKRMKNKIKKDRDIWAMDEKIKELDLLLSKI